MNAARVLTVAVVASVLPLIVETKLHNATRMQHPTLPTETPAIVTIILPTLASLGDEKEAVYYTCKTVKQCSKTRQMTRQSLHFLLPLKLMHQMCITLLIESDFIYFFVILLSWQKRHPHPRLYQAEFSVGVETWHRCRCYRVRGLLSTIAVETHSPLVVLLLLHSTGHLPLRNPTGNMNRSRYYKKYSQRIMICHILKCLRVIISLYPTLFYKEDIKASKRCMFGMFCTID